MKVRSWTVRTRIKVGWSRTGGWHDTNKWTSWKTVARCATAQEAFDVSQEPRFNAGLQRTGIFYGGRRLASRDLHIAIIKEREARETQVNES